MIIILIPRAAVRIITDLIFPLHPVLTQQLCRHGFPTGNERFPDDGALLSSTFYLFSYFSRRGSDISFYSSLLLFLT